MRRRLPIAAFAVLAIVAAGCGAAKRGTIPAGASQIPASARAVISIDLRQARKATALIGALTDSQRVVKALRDRSLGAELDLVVLDFENGGNDVVVLAQPKNASRLATLLAQDGGPSTHELLDSGWTAYADNYLLIDRLKSERSTGSMARSTAFREAMAGRPADALVRFYAAGRPLVEALHISHTLGLAELRAIAGSIRETDRGAEFELDAKGLRSTSAAHAAQLASRVPADALVYASFTNLTPLLEGLQSLPQVRQRLSGLGGLLVRPLLDTVFGLFGKEAALWVQPGRPDPRVTVMVQEADVRKALATVDAVASLSFSESEAIQVDGITAKRIYPPGARPIYYVALTGALVFSNSEDGIRSAADLLGPKLTGDFLFRRMKAEAGMPAETAGFVYLNFERRPIPDLRGPKALLVYLEPAKDGVTAKGLLSIK